MRAVASALAALGCAGVFAACAGSHGPPPAGVTIVRRPGYSGTLSDMASDVTAGTLLRSKGHAKLLEAEPFAPCPGEAGLQTFSVTEGPNRTVLLEVAFTQWSGTAVTASYRRAASAPPDPRALDALRQAVCSSPFGG